MKNTVQPFALVHSPNIPEILSELKFTLAISTFQAGKVIFLSAVSKDKLIQLPRTFDNAMGIATDETKMAIACRKDVLVLKNFPQLAKNYPAQKDTYDSFFLPRNKYFTGMLDLHDMNFIDNKLIAVNTLFSCLAEINEEHSFHPVWTPKFISSLEPQDRCHLNGVALKNKQIEYVTALGATDRKQGWRENKIGGGIILHTPSNEIILEGLSMPHSPRIYNDKLYFLNSAQGELCVADPNKGTYEVVTSLGGFARGMAKYGDFLFIGISKLRHTTSVFKDLPIAKTSYAGVVVVYLPYGKVIGQIKYETSVDEIYDVKILPGLNRPGILNSEKAGEFSAVVTPSTSYWAIPDPEKKD